MQHVHRASEPRGGPDHTVKLYTSAIQMFAWMAPLAFSFIMLLR